MSAPIVEPSADRQDRDRDRLFHFACSRLRVLAALLGAPVRCLCGTVQRQEDITAGSRRPPARLRCVVCTDLAAAHLATCATCRRAVAA